jgi:hypothetical protein
LNTGRGDDLDIQATGARVQPVREAPQAGLVVDVWVSHKRSDTWLPSVADLTIN